MKKILLLFPILAVLFFDSCSNVIIPTETFEGNYERRMISEKDKEIKANVTIYASESDIQDTFSVISINAYHPAIVIPIFYTAIKQQKLKLYQKAAQNAYALGGNGVLIESIGNYKVLKIQSSVSDKNSLSNKFADGTVANSPDPEKKNIYNSYFVEISRDITNVAKSTQINKIKKKIQIFDDYNNSLPKSNKKINKYIKTLTQQVTLKEYELLRQELMYAKRAAKKDYNSNFQTDRISQMFIAQRFEDGTVLFAKDKLQKKYVNLFFSEINDNIKAANTIEHIECIKHKLTILDNYRHNCKKAANLNMKVDVLYHSVNSKLKSIEKKNKKNNSL